MRWLQYSLNTRNVIHNGTVVLMYSMRINRSPYVNVKFIATSVYRYSVHNIFYTL